MNNELVRSAIAKKMKRTPEDTAAFEEYISGELPLELEEDPYTRTTRQMQRDRPMTADELMENPMFEGLMGMGSIGKLKSMLTPEAQAIRQMIQKRNQYAEKPGDVLQVEGGDLRDVLDAGREFDYLKGRKESAINQASIPAGYAFRHHVQSKGLDPDKLNPTKEAILRKEYENFMKDMADEGMVTKDKFWPNHEKGLGAEKAANRVHNKNRRELDKIYDAADALFNKSQTQDLTTQEQALYEQYKSVVDQLKWKARRSYTYRLPELSDLTKKAEIKPFGRDIEPVGLQDDVPIERLSPSNSGMRKRLADLHEIWLKNEGPESDKAYDEIKRLERILKSPLREVK